MMQPTNEIDDHELVAIVEAFEAARAADPSAPLARFVPATSHPYYAEIASELIRVDLELGWEKGQPRSLEDYGTQFPELLHDSSVWAGVAFEEYRLRKLAGDTITTIDYQRLYGIDIGLWPVTPHDGKEQIVVTSQRRDKIAALGLDSQFKPGAMHLGFKIEAELGRGASARVFLAKQESLANRHVVLKVTTDKTFEPDRLARLRHNNIVPLLSVHSIGPVNIMCMPFLGRHTLSDWVERLRDRANMPTGTGDLITTFTRGREQTVPTEATGNPKKSDKGPAAEDGVLGEQWQKLKGATYENAVLSILLDLARGLQHSHDRQVLHLDIKPANVLITEDGIPMLLDFHLGTVGELSQGPVEVEGGTLPYMSPEQLRSMIGQGKVDQRSDLYSMGVLAYELLTGHLPFKKRVRLRPNSPQDVETQIKVKDVLSERAVVPSPRDRNRGISQAAASIVMKCLAPTPEQRYATAADLAQDLSLHLSQMPLFYAPNTSRRELVSKWKQRHPRLTSGGFVFSLASVLVVAMGLAFGEFNKRLPRAEARLRLKTLQEKLPTIETDLYVSAFSPENIDASMLERARVSAENLLAPFQVLSDADWKHRGGYHLLSAQEQHEMLMDIGHMTYLLARTDLIEFGKTHKIDIANRGLKRIETAVECLVNSPYERSVLTIQADLMEALGRNDEAKAIRAQAELAPDQKIGAEANWRATEAALAGNFQSASELLAEYRHDRPQDARGWWLEGVCLSQIGNDTEAEKAFAVCLALDPNFASAYLMRGMVRYSKKEYDTALADFEAYGVRRKEDGAADFNCGLALIELKRFREALGAFNSALDKGFSQIRALDKRVLVETAMGHTPEAKSDRERFFQLQPVDAVEFSIRGFAFQQQKRYDEALADFATALQLDPRFEPAIKNVAYIEYDRGEVDKAYEIMNSLGNIVRNRELRADRAVLAARLGKSHAARYDITRALEGSDSAHVFYQAACVESLLSDGNLDQGLRFANQAFARSEFLANAAATDGDIARLRNDDRFKSLLEAGQNLWKKTPQ